jgi:peptidoglycan/xylan/chitin deacetylase (PgdA/CDA1 family)
MLNKVLSTVMAVIMIFSVNTGSAVVNEELPNYIPVSDSEAESREADVIQNPTVEKVVPAEKEEENEEESKRTIDPDKPMIALTFDDGPSKYTPEILDTLKNNNSSATFFVLGQEADKYKDTVKLIIEEGSEVGNHTYNHKDLTKLSDEEISNQILSTEGSIYDSSGYVSSLVRPPYGASNATLNKKISRPIIKWSVDTRDWQSRDAQKVTIHVLNTVKDGDIVLMHDIYKSTADASKIFIPKLVEMGYQLVTISELAEYRGLPLTAGQQYYNMPK